MHVRPVRVAAYVAAWLSVASNAAAQDGAQDAKTTAPAERAQPTGAGPPPDASLGAPPIGLGPEGFFLGTRESGYQLRLRGVVQVDDRSFPGQRALEPANGLLVRRARPYIEGTVARIVDFRLLPDFGGGTATIQDAWVDVRWASWLGVRGGKQKSPFGLERLQAEQALTFVERGLTADLAPDRDVGIDLHGDAAWLSYDLGIFDGAPDGSSVDGDTGAAKDVEARLFAHFGFVGLGAAVTSGRQQGSNATGANTSLASYRTGAQNVFFSYLVDAKGNPSVFAHGERLRAMPQANVYVGPFSFFAEYALERVEVQKDASTATLTQDAWQLAASVVLTGEHPSCEGVTPRTAIGSGPGALELGARFSALDLDPAAFPTYADPAKSARRARATAAVLNWYLDRNAKLAVQYEHTLFAGGARPSEDALLARLQAFF